MNYDELLADIASKNYRESRTLETPYAALDAVAKLHTLVQIKRGKSGLSQRCTECGFAYPCPTIQVIQKELA
jgi:hypothetical protein